MKFPSFSVDVKSLIIGAVAIVIAVILTMALLVVGSGGDPGMLAYGLFLWMAICIATVTLYPGRKASLKAVGVAIGAGVVETGVVVYVLAINNANVGSTIGYLYVLCALLLAIDWIAVIVGTRLDNSKPQVIREEKVIAP